MVRLISKKFSLVPLYAIMAVVIAIGVAFGAISFENRTTASGKGYISFESRVVLAAQNIEPKRTEIYLQGGVSIEEGYSPSGNTNGTLPWTNTTYAYADDTNYAVASPTYGAITSKQPAANVAGSYTQWTNPANAYDGGSNQYATVTIAAFSATSRPTGDNGDTAASTVYPASPTTRWDKVDEVSTNDTDYYEMVTNAGGHTTFTYTNFTLPAGSIVSNLTIYYRAGNVSTATCNIRATVETGTTYWDTIDAGVDPPDSPNFTTYSYAFTTNPSTGVAWTYDEINNADTNTSQRLVAFGTSSNDLNPNVRVTQVYATVNYIAPTQYDQVYGTFAITDPAATSNITKVEIGYEAYSDTSSKTSNFYTSSNGGSSWNAIHTSSAWPTSDPGTYTYINVTADQTWTWTALNSTNFKVKIETPVPTSACIRYLDNLIVRVTYDDRRAYSQIYTTYNATDVTGTVIKLEVGYLAYATATQSLDIYMSDDGGSTWSTAHNTGNLLTTMPTLITYIDCSSDFTWTPATVDNTNLTIKVATHWTNGTPIFYLDYLPVRIKFADYPTAPTSLASPVQSTTSINLTWVNGTGDKTLIRRGDASYSTAIASAEIMRVDGAGDYDVGGYFAESPASGNRWDKLDDVVPDDAATYIYCSDAANWRQEPYTLQNSQALVDSTIDNVTVYFRVQWWDQTRYYQPGLRLDSVENMGTQVSNAVPGGAWETLSETISRPGGGVWSLSDLDSLQVIIALKAGVASAAIITQLYISVSYSNAGTQVYFDTGSSTQDTGLSVNTTYYYRAWGYDNTTNTYSVITADLTQATSAGADISNAPSGRALGIVQTSTTYWTFGANTTAPSWPLTDAECFFVVTNNGIDAVNITIKGTDWIGAGTNWTLGANPGANTVRNRVWKSGDSAVSNNVTLTTSDQAFIDGLAASGTKYWEIAVDMPISVTDGNLKTGTVTLTATIA